MKCVCVCVCSGCMLCYISVYQCGLWSIVQVELKNTLIKLPCSIKLAFQVISLVA